jgi:hypothetical protein
MPVFLAEGFVFLERNQSNRAFEKCLRGGFFLRKKPLCRIALGYSYSGFAIVIMEWRAVKKARVNSECKVCLRATPWLTELGRRR